VEQVLTAKPQSIDSHQGKRIGRGLQFIALTAEVELQNSRLAFFK
jgi:hypothetical protein